VVLRANQQVTVDELRTFCKQSLAAYKVPKQIEFRDSLPKSAVGKVLRRELVRSEVLRRAGIQKEGKVDLSKQSQVGGAT